MLKKLLLAPAALAANLLLGYASCKQPKRQVYIWGNGVYTARPDSILQFENYAPKKINNLPADMACLRFGEQYEAGITEGGDLYVWDKHTLDSQNEDSTIDSLRQGIIKLDSNIKDVRFTTGFIWAVDKNNRVYQWAITNEMNTSTKNLEKKIGKKREVAPLRGTVQLQAGRDHLIALAEKGEVLAMGDDTMGQCGQTDIKRSTAPPFMPRRIKVPTKVANLSNIEKIASGANHNLAVDKQGVLYGWGSNSSLQISQEEQFSRLSNPLICSYEPTRITKNLQDVRISKVVAGDEFSVLVGENKYDKSCEVYSLGNNMYGQMGIGQTRQFRDVTKVEKLSNYSMKVKGQSRKVVVDQLECGRSHCIALLNLGYVMEWGHNEHGQMGNKKRSPATTPTLVKQFMGKKVVGVFAGENNSGVIVEEGTSE